MQKCNLLLVEGGCNGCLVVAHSLVDSAVAHDDDGI